MRHSSTQGRALSAPNASAQSPASSEASRAVRLKRSMEGKGFEDQERMLAPEVQGAAQHGVSGGGGAFPHAAQIQRSFGHHDVGQMRGHVGGAAREAADSIGSGTSLAAVGFLGLTGASAMRPESLGRFAQTFAFI